MVKTTGNLCATGQYQSPIQLKLSEAVRCKNKCNLVFHYKNSRCNIVRSKKHVRLEIDPGSYLVYNGNIFELEKMTFTAPSCHKVDKNSSEMEVHLHHKSPDTGSVLIVGVMLEVQEGSSMSRAFFDSWTSEIPAPRAGSNDDDIEKNINMSSEWNTFSILPEIKSFFTYNGSLIEAPCTENVTWIVFAMTTNISSSSFTKISDIIGQNSRAIQPTNARVINYNPNNSQKHNINQSNPIFCLTNKELVEKCARINRGGSASGESSEYTRKIKQMDSKTKILMSVLVIMGFLFILMIAILYKYKVFQSIAKSIKEMSDSNPVNL